MVEYNFVIFFFSLSKDIITLKSYKGGHYLQRKWQRENGKLTNICKSVIIWEYYS